MSYVLNYIWNEPDQFGDQVENPEKVKPKTKKSSEPVIVEKPGFDDFINELKHFQTSGMLKSVVIEKRPEPKPNAVWLEIQEQRRRILKLETEVIELTLEKRVEELESQVKELMKTIEIMK